MLRRLRRMETGLRGPEVLEAWPRMRDVAGRGIACDTVPGEKPTPRPL